MSFNKALIKQYIVCCRVVEVNGVLGDLGPFDLYTRTPLLLMFVWACDL